MLDSLVMSMYYTHFIPYFDKFYACFYYFNKYYNHFLFIFTFRVNLLGKGAIQSKKDLEWRKKIRKERKYRSTSTRRSLSYHVAMWPSIPTCTSQNQGHDVVTWLTFSALVQLACCHDVACGLACSQPIAVDFEPPYK